MGTVFKDSDADGRIHKIKLLVLLASNIVVLLLLCLFAFICNGFNKHRTALNSIVYTDRLTGGDNENSFYIKAEKLLETAAGSRYAFVMFDINRFKMINDLFGYTVGNEVLKHAAKSLMEGITGTETAARISGDIFYCLLEYTSKDDLEKRVEKLSSGISGFKFANGQQFNMVVCAGIYVVEDKSVSIDDMSICAKLATMQAKGGHENTCVFYDEKIRVKIREESEILNDMHTGLKNGEFVVYIQPKVDVITGKIAGGELLVRWNHPQKGLLTPKKFIPVFEKNGFVTEIDMFVFESACRIQKSLMSKGFAPIVLSVNQSRLHMHNPNYIKTLKSIAEKYKVPPSCIELEITESAFFSNMGIMADVTSELRGLGFRMAMDDFGSGYSSLNMLGDINVDVIKIGQEFFDRENSAGRIQKIVESIVQLAKNLDIETVAEGVSTQEMAEFLKKIGCDTAQGYFYSKPVPVPDFIKMLS